MLPMWLMIALAILFGWLIMPRIVSFAGGMTGSA